ncbi:MAG: alpha-amylase family glycosyl hydrolase [bacterium]
MNNVQNNNNQFIVKLPLNKTNQPLPQQPVYVAPAATHVNQQPNQVVYANNIPNIFFKSPQPQKAVVAPQVAPQQQANTQSMSSDWVSSWIKVKMPAAANASTAVAKAAPVQKISDVKLDPNFHWKNDLRQLFHENKACIMAVLMNTFNAKDKDGDRLIQPSKGEEFGTWYNGIERLDEMKALGINTLHILPPNPPGAKGAMGNNGSRYAVDDYTKLDPMLDDPKCPLGVEDEAKLFIQEAHKRGIRVMFDLASCFSIDQFEKSAANQDKNPATPKVAVNPDGTPAIPQGWEDIRMMDPWEDKDKRILHKGLMDYHKKFIDLAQRIGVDGIRADVARAKPVEFWNELIAYSRSKDPNFCWLAESYCYEDASPMQNVPADRPEELLKVGFDSYYGQDHLFPLWKNSKDFHDNMLLNLDLSHKVGPNKSVIGSMHTHDDRSPMSNGGAPYCCLTAGAQLTLPMTNPYFTIGFESGDRYLYPYDGKPVQGWARTDSKTYVTHSEFIDIFNTSDKPHGDNPEIGQYMTDMTKVRKQYEDVITKGSYIPLKTTNKEDLIIGYARHYNGKTLLAIANKDVNAVQQGKVKVPTLKEGQVLKDLSPAYGAPSNYVAKNGEVDVELGPARFHLFEIDTPEIEKAADGVYSQNLDLSMYEQTPIKD